MFPDILLLENTLIQFYFSLCAFTQSFFENNVKYLPCLTTENNLKPDKSHFIYSQTIGGPKMRVFSSNILFLSK